jgi:alanine dehydrogenase
MSPEIRVLRERDLQRLLDVPTALEIIEQTWRNYGLRNSHTLSQPSALSSGTGNVDDARYRVKGATLHNEQITGIRLISDPPIDADSDYKSRHMLWVYDDRTANPIGLLHETWLHRFRTALTAVVAAKFLARPGSKTVALIGAGAIAQQLFPALPDSFDLQEIRVVARRLESAERFCHEQAAANSTKMVAVESAAQAIDNADIVITLTLAETPVIQPGMLSPGSFLCSMGETEEVEISVLEETDRFIVDEFDYATLTGDMAYWLEQRHTTREQLGQRVDAHIGQVVSGQRPGRQTDTERIYAIIQGMAICDLALANYALQQAAEQDFGETLDLFDGA